MDSYQSLDDGPWYRSKGATIALALVALVATGYYFSGSKTAPANQFQSMQYIQQHPAQRMAMPQQQLVQQPLQHPAQQPLQQPVDMNMLRAMTQMLQQQQWASMLPLQFMPQAAVMPQNLAAGNPQYVEQIRMMAAQQPDKPSSSWFRMSVIIPVMLVVGAAWFVSKNWRNEQDSEPMAQPIRNSYLGFTSV